MIIAVPKMIVFANGNEKRFGARYSTENSAERNMRDRSCRTYPLYLFKGSNGDARTLGAAKTAPDTREQPDRSIGLKIVSNL